jgi:phosphodiesterase/alkaline phosphatase D-like protein
MKRLLLKLAIIAAVGSPLASHAIFAQLLPPAKKAAHVRITEGPALESAHDDVAILRWTTTNPGGSDDHFGVVSYGTDPTDLSQTAKSPNRLNRNHLKTIFRVRMGGLKPRTTYYYKVSSIESGGASDGAQSPVNQFTTPAPGERVMAYNPRNIPIPRMK